MQVSSEMNIRATLTLAWLEPRFANVILLSEEERQACHWDETSPKPWGKGLVGVAYLVTLDDMAKIFATEGGLWISSIRGFG